MKTKDSLDYHGLIPHLPEKERKKVVREFEKKYSHFWDSVNIQSTSMILMMIVGAGVVSAFGLLDEGPVSRILWMLASALPALLISCHIGRLVRAKNESKFLDFVAESWADCSGVS